MILRVSRLGKEIALKFADRYYDAIAPGEDFVAMDVLRGAKAAGKPWTKALAFDYSLAIGEWVTGDGLQVTGDYVLSPEEAIVEASKVMTIRQGDLIYIQADCEPRRVQKEEVLRVEIEGEEKLYCKIK
jgi:2-keto-4-pentenoate hydratase/2-oxohepta-3-ene-1,7-dioic acid hydratase in catechol pathway